MGFVNRQSAEVIKKAVSYRNAAVFIKCNDAMMLNGRKKVKISNIFYGQGKQVFPQVQFSLNKAEDNAHASFFIWNFVKNDVG